MEGTGAATVARKKQSGSETRRLDAIVRTDRDLLEQAKRLLAHMTAEEKERDGADVATLFVNILQPVIRERHDRLVKRTADAIGKAPKATKGKGENP